ncbi:MAG: beta-1,6-N-acetylglucosaminyltransferase [Lachnospiraceae bacterium]|nr:beta-1,6-N-acetylglucosaminyltransferase [Lachnospiraceae bacterium]
MILKHAYLILTHEYTLVLERLVQLLDNEYNGIYIHIDKKTTDAEKKKIEGLQQLVKRSELFVFCKYKVFWGTNSIVKAQKLLLTKSVVNGYDYYHFLSGADLPVKKADEIQKFFEENNGREFIHFGTREYQQDIQQRYNVYHFFTRQLGRKRDKKFWVDVETYSLAIQRRLHVDRTRKLDFSFFGGSNWCSITRKLALYVVKNFHKYERTFYFSQISDEAIWQTIVMDSPYRDNLYVVGFDNNYDACVRYIDWERGAPYVFREEDFNDLMASKCMFARKFDERCDAEIVEHIYKLLKE